MRSLKLTRNFGFESVKSNERNEDSFIGLAGFFFRKKS